MVKSKIKKGLGRGFDTLISLDFDKSLIVNADEHIKSIPISKIVPRQDQPRTQFNDQQIQELAQSIKRYGIVVPLIVCPFDGDVAQGNYQIIAGERRWRAARLVGLKHLPVVIRTMQELEKNEISLIENVQRVDLTPLDQATSIVKLHEQFSMPYEEIAKRLGKATSTVNNIVRLLSLPDFVKDSLNKGEISEGHARAILALKDSVKNQQNLLKSIINFGWSVRQAESYVISLKKEGIKEHTRARARVSSVTPETKLLSKKLNTDVKLKRMAKGGFLEIGFKSDDELLKIINRID